MHDVLIDEVGNDPADLRYDHYLEEKSLRLFKTSAQKWADAIGAEIIARVAPALQSNLNMEWLRAEVSAATQLFTGIETPRRELVRMKAKVPYIEPKTRVLGSSTLAVQDDSGHIYRSGSKRDVVHELPMVQTITRMLQHDARLRHYALEKNKDFKSGRLYHKKVDPITDVIEAETACNHGELWRPATDDERYDLRMPLGFYNDAFEVCATVYTWQDVVYTCPPVTCRPAAMTVPNVECPHESALVTCPRYLPSLRALATCPRYVPSLDALVRCNSYVSCGEHALVACSVASSHAIPSPRWPASTRRSFSLSTSSLYLLACA